MPRKWISSLFLISALLNVAAQERESGGFLSRYGFHQEINLYPELLALYIPMDPNMAVALSFGTHRQTVQSMSPTTTRSMNSWRVFGRRTDTGLDT